MQKLKRGPPYDDDPGCKYIVIEDPWPGNAIGKARDERYFNLLCAWVRFMLGKAHEVECVYVVNTRNEVIVQLPQEADIVPIVGAHPWKKMFLRGEKKDADRVSYVFAYDYRNKGDPAKHNWQETYPTVNGDPPSHIRFPVVFPYPHVSWATPRGKNCADIALQLPPIRQPTPIPDTSLFTPYQHPTSLTTNTVSNAEVTRQQLDNRSEQEQQQPPTAEADDVHSPENESRDVDVKPCIKIESSDVNVKTETVKREEKVYAPSKAFRSTIEQLRQPSATVVDTAGPSVTESPEVDVKAKMEDPGARGPSESFVAAISQIRSAVPQTEPSTTPNVKVEQPPAPPSDAFVAAIRRLRAPPSDSGLAPPIADSGPVKQERHDSTPSPTQLATRDPRVKVEHSVHALAPSGKPSTISSSIPKRVKEGQHDGPVKRFKSEYRS